MRWWLLFTATCLLAAGCSQSPGEPETDLQAVVEPAVEEAEAEPASDLPEEPVDQFDFEAAIGGVARIEAEVCDGGSVGTGFMIDERHIVTVAHVIEGATSILVEVNGDLAEAVTVGFDKERDIALLRSDIPLGDQTFELQEFDYTTGDQIFAIGFPRGLDASLTTGVISNREVEFDFMPFSRFIQVDAPLNPGNSGGPVFNEAGDVIGIVDWGISESQGLNFAIAVSSVDRVIGDWVGNEEAFTGGCGNAVDSPVPGPSTAVTTAPAAQRVFADHFSFELPSGYVVVDLDKDVGYGLRTRLEGPGDAFIHIENSPWGGGSLFEAASAIADSVGSRLTSGPTSTVQNGTEAVYFTFRSSAGDPRIDIFFRVGERGFAILGGSSRDFTNVEAISWEILSTITTVDAPPHSGDTGRLIELTSSRGVPVLVPEGWTAEFIDGGGSGSWSVWTNPASESQTLTVESGVSMGAWFELDGVSGSIDPTMLVSPWIGANGQLDRLDRYTFTYSGFDPSGTPVRGAWLATLAFDGSVCCFLQLSVTGTDAVTASEIIGHFLEVNRS